MGLFGKKEKPQDTSVQILLEQRDAQYKPTGDGPIARRYKELHKKQNQAIPTWKHYQVSEEAPASVEVPRELPFSNESLSMMIRDTTANESVKRLARWFRIPAIKERDLLIRGLVYSLPIVYDEEADFHMHAQARFKDYIAGRGVKPYERQRPERYFKKLLLGYPFHDDQSDSVSGTKMEPIPPSRDELIAFVDALKLKRPFK